MRYAWLFSAYAVPAAIVWTAAGLLLNLLPLSALALVLMTLYAAVYGFSETTGKPRLSPPSSRWQVPSRWVVGVPKWRRTLVWGSALGPGFASRNPYAGFALLPLAIAAIGSVWAGAATAAAVGIAHGMGRALALLRTSHGISGADYLESVLRSMYWRMRDGLILLMIGGGALVACVYRF